MRWFLANCVLVLGFSWFIWAFFLDDLIEFGHSHGRCYETYALISTMRLLKYMFGNKLSRSKFSNWESLEQKSRVPRKSLHDSWREPKRPPWGRDPLVREALLLTSDVTDGWTISWSTAPVVGVRPSARANATNGRGARAAEAPLVAPVSRRPPPPSRWPPAPPTPTPGPTAAATTTTKAPTTSSTGASPSTSTIRFVVMELSQ